jgi:glycosyltransferase involved in cell wall biosynthesis
MIQSTASVTMCTFNGARYIQHQLDSICGQSLRPSELLVCDDFSTDDTVPLIKRFAEVAPFPVRLVVNSTNLGSSRNFAQAIELSKGDIIALADQDDVWKPEKLLTLVDTLDKNPDAGYVFSDAELVDENLIPLNRTLWDAVVRDNPLFKRYLVDNGAQFLTLLKGNVVTGATLAFRSCIKELILPISPLWVHDGWIAILATAIGMRGIALATPLILYRQHSSQQLGVRRSDELRRSGKLRIGNANENIRWVQNLQAVKERLQELNTSLGNDITPAIRLLDEKVLHDLNRISLQTIGGNAKFSMILKEVLAGRYHRFSDSWLSALKDLLT